MSETQILYQISAAADTYDDWKRLELFAGESSEAGLHIACMVEPFLSYILRGKKTIESRFSKPLIPPYHRVAVGDVVLLKAGPIVASFRTASAEFIELNDREFSRVVTDYSEAICADEEFWDARVGKRYATLLGISDVRQLTPLKIDKHDRRGWMVLRDSLAALRPTNPCSYEGGHLSERRHCQRQDHRSPSAGRASPFAALVMLFGIMPAAQGGPSTARRYKQSACPWYRSAGHRSLTHCLRTYLLLSVRSSSKVFGT